MIIPTPEYDRLFARDGVPFRDKMHAYIRREFADLIGPREIQALLQPPSPDRPANGSVMTDGASAPAEPTPGTQRRVA